jgi:hypothetical protein
MTDPDAINASKATAPLSANGLAPLSLRAKGGHRIGLGGLGLGPAEKPTELAEHVHDRKTMKPGSGGLHNLGHNRGESIPSGPLSFELTESGTRQPIILGAPVVLGGFPLGFEKASPFP